MKRTRRRLLKVFLLWPLSLAAPRIFAAQDYVVIDGWVMKRTELEPEQPMGRHLKNAH